MKRYHVLSLLGLVLVIAGLALVNQPTTLAQDAEPTQQYLQGIYEAWMSSPHNDAESEAFVHWNDEGVVEVACAKCHSTPGYIDFLGADGSAAGSVENEAIPVGTTVNCDACHNDAAQSLTSVTFPSGATLNNLDDSARCMNCHQGRSSTVQVDARLAELALPDVNTVSADIRFMNIHYYPAAASLYGAEVQGGYQFAGKSYQPRFEHVEGYNTCIGCHDPHTLEVKLDECAACHEDVEEIEDVQDIRMPGSSSDYDGDGDTREGIYEEIETLQEMLYSAMVAYSTEVAGVPIRYDAGRYPYMFADPNGNGEADEGEEGYASFTPLLLQAAYNYQLSVKDPGGYVHSSKYHIELLFDSIEALNAQISQPVDLSTAERNDSGHFDGTAEAFRHWDEEGVVPGSCAKCHTSGGVPQFLAEGTTISAAPGGGLRCTTCHVDLVDFEIHPIAEVKFPSGANVTFGENDEANVCLMCHQGRESTTSVNAAIGRSGAGPDDVTDQLSFRNVHYFAAGATLFGSEAQGIYQYEGKEYSGRFMHDGERAITCTDCHDEHALENRVSLCEDCHEGVETQEDVRMIRADAEDAEPIDYNGNGDTSEPIAAELESFQVALYAAIQAYGTANGNPIVYNAYAYPYFFADVDANGEFNEGDERYATWTPRLLQAAYNYQYSLKDPGAFAHNADYVMQALYDSIEALGGAEAVAGFTRPPVSGGE
jgi:hypothetical protein